MKIELHVFRYTAPVVFLEHCDHYMFDEATNILHVYNVLDKGRRTPLIERVFTIAAGDDFAVAACPKSCRKHHKTDQDYYRR